MKLAQADKLAFIYIATRCKSGKMSLDSNGAVISGKNPFTTYQLNIFLNGGQAESFGKRNILEITRCFGLFSFSGTYILNRELEVSIRLQIGKHSETRVVAIQLTKGGMFGPTPCMCSVEPRRLSRKALALN